MAPKSVIDVALRLLSRNPYSVKRLMEKLAKGFSESEIQDCLEKLKNWGYLNDSQFGVNRLHQLQERLKSRSYVIMDLEEQGLEKQLIHELITAYYPEKLEYEIAKKIIQKKLKSDKGLKTKIWVSLIGAGFSENTVHHCFPDIDPT